MLKNVSYHPTISGAIRLGKVVSTESGASFFVPTEHLEITHRYKDATTRTWVPHPLHQALLDRQKIAGAASTTGVRRKKTTAEEKLKEIPVRLLYSKADLNSSERYEVYDQINARFICAGNGKTARRITHENVVQDTVCNPLDCEYGTKRGCSVRGRTLVAIEGQEDPLAGFLIRSNTVRGAQSLRVQIEMLCTRHSKYVQGLPLVLSIGMVSVNDFTVYYPQIRISGDEAEAIVMAKAYMKKMRKLGVDFNVSENRLLELSLGSPLHVGEITDLDDERTAQSKPETTVAKRPSTVPQSYHSPLANAINQHKLANQPIAT